MGYLTGQIGIEFHEKKNLGQNSIEASALPCRNTFNSNEEIYSLEPAAQKLPDDVDLLFVAFA